MEAGGDGPWETALLLIDVWNCHWCAAMSQRTTDLAYRLNRTASTLRARGVHIVHSPSSPGLEFYQGYGNSGNFDIIFDHLSRIPRLFTIPHAPCALIYLVTMLIGC